MSGRALTFQFPETWNRKAQSDISAITPRTYTSHTEKVITLFWTTLFKMAAVNLIEILGSLKWKLPIHHLNFMCI